MEGCFCFIADSCVSWKNTFWRFRRLLWTCSFYFFDLAFVVVHLANTGQAVIRLISVRATRSHRVHMLYGGLTMKEEEGGCWAPFAMPFPEGPTHTFYHL